MTWARDRSQKRHELIQDVPQGTILIISGEAFLTLTRILLGLFRRFLFRYKNNRTYRISIPKRTDFVLF